MNEIPDPFDTAALRAAVLTAWRDSPTRLREDSATEADLVRAGYRDRLLTELAQNAADAAVKADVAGRLGVTLRGRALHIANTGAPLDISGVHSLTALRASAKSESAAAVGRFGVGFTAVLSAGEEIEFRSTTGSLRFSRADTRVVMRERGIELPRGAEYSEPPVLRLAWPVDAGPETGFDSEIVVWLREGVDASALLESMRTEAPDLLLELPGLRSIRIEEYESWSAAEDFGNGLRKVWITTGGRESSWWEYTAPRARWLLPIRDDQAVAAAPDVLRAPTRTDEELSLPALLIADIALQPDRRRLLPGARLAELAEGYADFARALPPADRCVLIPVPGFARSEADGRLREALLAELREGAWLPVVPTADRPGPAVAVPARSSVFLGATAELAGLLGELVAPLVVAELSGRGTSDLLASVDVHRLGLARIAELTAGADHPPSWWYSLYDALEPFVTDPLAAEELGALGVLLSDGRVVTGPRTVLLDDQLHDAIAVPWARLVHPEAAHELLGRLGARAASIEDLLTDPALRAELDHRPDDEDLRAAVLRLAAHLSPGTVLPSWLGALEFPDDTGELRPADELLLPGAPLADVLVPDSPFGTLDADLARRYPDSAWRAIGVGWAFAVVSESDPTGPDHDLDDEDLWWDDLAEDPPEFTAVRDLDLVDDDAWPQALRLLLDDPATRPLLGDRDGYTAWWLRRYARIDGHPLGVFGTGADPVLDGVLPRLPGMSETDLPALAAVLADPDKITTQLALALLDALADASKTPSPEAISHIHARLGDAATHLDLEMFDAPERVRALSGAVIDPEDALVLDQPWFGQVLPPDRLVVGDIRSAATLATLLDVPLVSEAVQAEIVGAGRRTTWAAEPLGVLLRLQFGIPAPAGDLVLHERLEVRLGGAEQTTVAVQWWREGDTTHVQRPGAGG